MIPKRNLIRWKHEYLLEETHEHRENSEDSVGFGFGELDGKKDSMETKVNLTTESTDLIKLP